MLGWRSRRCRFGDERANPRPSSGSDVPYGIGLSDSRELIRRGGYANGQHGGGLPGMRHGGGGVRLGMYARRMT